jgi:hypothetical protein
MKKIGFLSFGHWTPSSQSQTRSAVDTLLLSIELAVAAKQLGADGVISASIISRASLPRPSLCLRPSARSRSAVAQAESYQSDTRRLRDRLHQPAALAGAACPWTAPIAWREISEGQVLIKLIAASEPNGSEASGPPTSSQHMFWEIVR